VLLIPISPYAHVTPVWKIQKGYFFKTFAEKFIPSPMEEIIVPAPKPLAVRRHTEDEFTREQRGLLLNQDAPDTQRAQVAYYRSGNPQVPSYN
jgi:hypothetical protein